jgi:putative Ca2+/H+ antiporter (TMEM165/GDT1 family)
MSVDWKVFATTFGIVFMAELGDKTQLATLMLAADKPAAKWMVFAGAASALTLAADIGVLAGGWLAQYVSPRMLQFAAGIGFVGMGLWILKGAWPA